MNSVSKIFCFAVAFSIFAISCSPLQTFEKVTREDMYVFVDSYIASDYSFQDLFSSQFARCPDYFYQCPDYFYQLRDVLEKERMYLENVSRFASASKVVVGSAVSVASLLGLSTVCSEHGTGGFLQRLFSGNKNKKIEPCKCCKSDDMCDVQYHYHQHYHYDRTSQNREFTALESCAAVGAVVALTTGVLILTDKAGYFEAVYKAPIKTLGLTTGLVGGVTLAGSGIKELVNFNLYKKRLAAINEMSSYVDYAIRMSC